MNPTQLIVVDDDADLRSALVDYLTRHGFAVIAACDGVELDGLLARGRPGLVVLDLMMPGEDGLSICRRLQSQGIPILMLSALGEAMDRVVGLEAGAHDYLGKPFEPRELLARIRAILRNRRGGAPADDPPLETIRIGIWSFDPNGRRLVAPGASPVELTLSETRMLKVFVERPGRVIHRDSLIELVRGPTAEVFDRSIDLLVSRLRRKLDLADLSGIIQTLRGEGYRFDPRVLP